MNIWISMLTGNPLNPVEKAWQRFAVSDSSERFSSIMMVAPLWSLWRPSLLDWNGIKSGSLGVWMTFFGSFGDLDHILTFKSFNLYTPHFLSTSSIGCMLNHECGWYSYFTCHTNTLFSTEFLHKVWDWFWGIVSHPMLWVHLWVLEQPPGKNGCFIARVLYTPVTLKSISIYVICNIVITYIYTYMYICVCIHTYVRPCIHTCIHACMHTCTHAYMHTCIHAYMHTCIHAYIHRYIDT